MSDVRLVTDPEHLLELCQRWQSEPALAFDTEFVPEFTFTPQLCLIQVATPTETMAIDPIVCTDLRPFWNLITSPERELVVHAGKEELAFCKAYAGQTPHKFFDIQIAAGLVGHGYPLSLDNLIQKLIRVRKLSKSETRTDWRRRPLTTEQIDYALDDVRYLLELRDLLHESMEQQGRLDWLKEETQRMVESLARHAEERWTRVPGSGGLRGRDLAVFRELVKWRDERARQIDKPARWVLRDDLLVEIAKRQPKSAEELKTIRGLASLSPRQAAEQLIVAIKRGQSAPPVERPRGTPRRPANEEQMIVKILSAALIQVAHSQRVAPGLLGSNEDLREFLRYVLDPSDDSEPPKLASGWRRSICWEYLSDVLEGRVSLRIRRTGEHLDLEFHSG